MILINEFLPNPTGSDADGEWIELFNSGTTAQDITGWTLAAGAKGKFVFPKTEIRAGEYLVVSRKQTKLTLRNSDESVSFFDAGGNRVDVSLYVGTAPEGKSWSRLSSEAAGKNFVFAAPTPGEANKNLGTASLIENVYSAHAPLNTLIGNWEMISLALGAAVVLASLVVYIAIKNEYCKNLFFGKY